MIAIHFHACSAASEHRRHRRRLPRASLPPAAIPVPRRSRCPPSPLTAGRECAGRWRSGAQVRQHARRGTF